MLRNPMARTLSAFYTSTGRALSSNIPNPQTVHFLCTPGSRPFQMMQDPTFSIEDFVRLPKTERDHCNQNVNNLHVNYLASDIEKEPLKRLAVAKRRLQNMAWFGILEQSELSMRLLSYTFGIDLFRYTKVSNINNYNRTLSPQAQRVLREMNSLDLKLYDFALGLFKKRADQMLLDHRDQHYISDNFKCDHSIRCWDKVGTDDAWDKGVDKDLSYLTDGERKSRILCSPISGCTRLHTTKTDLTRPHTNGCLLSFAIIGTRKGGTTSLYNYLTRHDRVLGVRLDQGPKSGELFFFRQNEELVSFSSSRVRTEYNKVFRTELERMRSLDSTLPRFDPRVHVTGESSVGMGPSCTAPGLLRRACGGRVKLVFLARNPIERLISQYKMRARHNRTKTGLNEIEHLIEEDLNHFLQVEPKEPRWWESPYSAVPCLFEEDYLNSIWSGLYIVHLSRWLQFYDASNLLVFKSEDFFKNPTETLRQTYDFLGLSYQRADLEKITSKVYNAANESTGARANFVDN